MTHSSAGVVSTHSTNMINYESLGASTTFSMSITVHDGKQLVTDTLTINVHDVNEAPIFVQPAFGASAVEGTVNLEEIMCVFDDI